MDASNFVCCFCKNIPTSVAESGCCHSLFCWSCVLDNNGTPCPSCNAPFNPNLCVDNAAIQKLIDKIPTVCKNEGCYASVVPSAMRQHDAECEYAIVMCSNSELCGLLTRREIAKHEREACIYRTVRCHSCEVPLPLNELQAHLEQNCPNVIVECTHNCGAKVLRAELPHHTDVECAHAPGHCPFLLQGCGEELMKGQIEAHLRDDVSKHVMLLKALVEEQRAEIFDLQSQVRELQAAPQLQLQQIQQYMMEFLRSFQPAIQRISTDVRARLRLSSLFWILLFWFGLSSVHFLIRVAVVFYWFGKGHQRYVQPFYIRRSIITVRDRVFWHNLALLGSYVTACFWAFIIIMKLC